MPLRQRIKQRIEHLSGQIQRLLGRQALLGSPPVLPRREFSYDEWVPTLWADVDLQRERHLREPARVAAEARRWWGDNPRQFRPVPPADFGDGFMGLVDGHIDTLDGVPYPVPYVPRRQPRRNDIEYAGPNGGLLINREVQTEIINRITEQARQHERAMNTPRHLTIDMAAKAISAKKNAPQAGDTFWLQKILALRPGETLLYANKAWSPEPVLCTFEGLSWYTSPTRYLIKAQVNDPDISYVVDYAEFFAVSLDTP